MKLFRGDAYEQLAKLPDGSIDSCVTDPPAGIAFMGKDWDKDKGGRNDWTDWLTDVFEQVYRVLKPGGHCLIWALPRTSHWTAWAVEDAGFEIRDIVTHHFGTGFPKSLNVGKAIDKAAGAEREVVGREVYRKQSTEHAAHSINIGDKGDGKCSREWDITAPATDAAKQWEGFGTALKPASEHWVLARKPLEGTVAANVLKHGVGALNIDGCRTALHEQDEADTQHQIRQTQDSPTFGQSKAGMETTNLKKIGRWPANLVLSHSPDCVAAGVREVKTGVAVQRNRDGEVHNQVYGDFRKPPEEDKTYGEGGKETIPAYKCAPGCPVAELDRQSGESGSGKFVKSGKRASKVGTLRSMSSFDQSVKNAPDNYGDKGGASRFFYCPKAPKKERGEGNDHPTVKALGLMRWLIRLVTPPGGTVLDPFMGSGSTGVAAKEEGFEFVGVELDGHYFDLAQRRIEVS